MTDLPAQSAAPRTASPPDDAGSRPTTTTDGTNGTEGTDGRDGREGTDGTDGTDGRDGGNATDTPDAGRDGDAPDDVEDEPWALSLVVRVEKAAPPTHTDVLTAAAGAVVALLTDPRVTAPDGELRPAVQAWRGRRIRKIGRRARGGRWERTATLPHVEVTAGTAVVRAFAPHPRDAAPPALGGLQVGGLDLPDAYGPPRRADDPPTPLTPELPDAVAARALTIRLSPGVEMSTGKQVAQVGHAAQLALELLDPHAVAAWLAAGAPLRVLVGAPVLPPGRRVDVRDGGYTEVAPGTLTVSSGFEG